MKELLEQRRREICAEISDYPSPIAGCDAQFNGLLEDRQRILIAMRDMMAARADPTRDFAQFSLAYSKMLADMVAANTSPER